MAELDRVRFVTERYEQLQGLRLLPVSMPFLLSAAWRAGWLGGWPSQDPRHAAYWFVGGFAVAIALSFIIRSWYHRQFGVVRARPWRTGLISMSFVFVCFVALASLQSAFAWPISMPVVFVGPVFAYLATSGG